MNMMLDVRDSMKHIKSNSEIAVPIADPSQLSPFSYKKNLGMQKNERNANEHTAINSTAVCP